MSGLIVIYSRTLKVGELVQAGDTFGTVGEIGFLTTRISTPKREVVTIPSGELAGSIVTNYSRRAEGASPVLAPACAGRLLR